MSTVTTYLVIIHQLTGDMIRATEYFGEQDTRHELSEVHFYQLPVRKEIHLSYELIKPLSEEQLERLAWMKELSMIAGWYVKDEISPDVPSQEEQEEDEETTQALNAKLGFDVTDHEQLKAYWQRFVEPKPDTTEQSRVSEYPDTEEDEIDN